MVFKAQRHKIRYAITSSADFYGTLDKVVKGLNNAGFSNKDYRVKDVEEPPIVKSEESKPIV